MGIAVYETLLGRGPDWRSENRQAGTAAAMYRVDNTAIELLAPNGTRPGADRLTEILGGANGALTTLAFRADNIGRAHRVLTRRGLKPTDVADGGGTHLDTEAKRQWQYFRLSDDICSGIKTFILSDGAALPAHNVPAAAAHSLDHVVINTPNPTRALAHYGGRLGLDLRLDRTIEAFKTRFLFFKIGSLVFEIIHRPDVDNGPDDPDRFYGLTWAVRDLEAAHARLSKAGLDISDIRMGRKPGTRVFTVRNGTLGIPTLFIRQTAA